MKPLTLTPIRHATGRAGVGGFGRGRRRGATIVEAAIVLPVALMLILGTFEFSRMFFVQHMINEAARAGARYAVVNTNSLTTSEVKQWIHNKMPAPARPFQGYNMNSSIRVFKCDKNGAFVADPLNAANTDSWQSAGFNEYIAVEIKGNYKTIMPIGLVGVKTVPMRAFSMMFSEAN